MPPTTKFNEGDQKRSYSSRDAKKNIDDFKMKESISTV
jgi:hypothetical protein